ncbi:probable aspartyl protease At4g16563 [Phragmites australis]|uniref:probable aspartyl protease At4g16563 n=1 Tax=Phragmites australis TaxID=29695 RepID=UPI002D76FFD5|nr:probable aspartyl protease At4g16563 [Phragmites australis]
MHPSIHICTILLCIISSLFHSHAEDSKPQTMGSVVLGLCHVRSLFTPSMGILNSTKNDFLDIIEPVTAYTDGYLLSLNLGTPPQVFQVYLDTGSDLTWVPCGTSSYECMECGNEHGTSKPTPTFSPSQSSSNTRDLCGSRFCVDIHSSDNRYDPCAAAGCSIPAFTSGLCPRACPSFSYTYGGGALVMGSLARDVVTLHGSMDGTGPVPVEFPGFCFGCVGSSIREPIGIAGFGKGTLSLPSQLGFLGKGFSHCFLGFRFARNPNITSPLVMGDLALSATDGFLFTPMLKSITYPNFYYIGLEGVSLGDDGAAAMAAAPPSLIGIDPEGNGGVIVDTGTTYTHLPGPFYASIMSSLSSIVPYDRSYDLETRTGFDLCFKIPCPHAPCTEDELPPISLHFLGDVKLTLPKQSCYYAVTAPKDSVVVKCLLFQRMDDGDGNTSGPGAVLGSFQMQNLEVVYDLEMGRVGFQPRDCALHA